MKFADYAKLEAENWSSIKHLERSELHYWHAKEEGIEDTTRLAMGRGVHTAVLEPHKFPTEYAIFKGPRRAGKEWEAFKAVHDEDTILKLEEFEHAIAVAKAVHSHSVAGKYLKRATAVEHVITWTDSETGLLCKARLDFIGDDFFGDVKSTTDCDSYKFGGICARMLYHGQMAFYHDGLFAATGVKRKAIVIPCEIKKPYDVAVFSLDEDALSLGRSKYRELLAKAAVARELKSRRGRYPEEQILRLPSWMFLDEEHDSDVADVIDFGGATMEA
jgi:hypothetical protein